LEKLKTGGSQASKIGQQASGEMQGKYKRWPGIQRILTESPSNAKEKEKKKRMQSEI